MVRVTFYQDPSQQLAGFDCSGHADYSEGSDIVCAGVSALVITCINSIETLTEDRFTCRSDAGNGDIVFRLSEGFGEKSQLLLKSLMLGLEEMEEGYADYIDLIIEEVQKT